MHHSPTVGFGYGFVGGLYYGPTKFGQFSKNAGNDYFKTVVHTKYSLYKLQYILSAWRVVQIMVQMTQPEFVDSEFSQVYFDALVFKYLSQFM